MFNAKETVLDTFIFEQGGIFLKDHHQQRSYEALKIINPEIAADQVDQIYKKIEKEFSPRSTDQNLFRLLLAIDQGQLIYQIEVKPKFFFPENPKLQIMSALRVPAGLGKQNYKWNHRDFWKNAMTFKSPAADDLIFFNQNDQVTETSRGNLFFFDVFHNVVWTPSLSSGCINGVYRRYVMNKGHIQLPGVNQDQKVIEKDIHLNQVNSFQVYVANSVRKVLKASLIST